MFKKGVMGWFLLLTSLTFPFTLVENKNSKAIVFLPKETFSYAEKLAVNELTNFIEQSTGIKLPIVSNYEKQKNVVIIGTKESLKDKGFLSSEDVNFLDNFYDYDAFIVKTYTKSGQDFLIFAGSNERSCLYSIYHFLENVLKFGFYWEGDVVPKYNKIKVENLKIYEKAFFSIRFYMQECDYGYTTRPWDIDNWKKELLWMCKKKLNMIFIAEDHWNFIVKREEIVDEAKKLGLICVFHVPLYRWAAVDKKFVEENPDHKYIEAKYRNPYYYIYPTDELFIERGRNMIKALVEKYGKGNFYFVSPYGEASFPSAKQEELTQLRKDFAKTVIDVILSEDPDGKWIFWTWPFGFLNWDKKDVEIFLKQIPKDKVFICDSPEEIGEWHYKRYDDFFGYNFVLSYILLYGGDDQLKGNIFKAQNEVEACLKKENLKGIYICPEIIHYNTIYFDLLTYLAWNPVDFNIENYVNNFVLRRYGEKSYEKMRKAWDYLIKGVYEGVEGSEPLYQRRIYPPGEGLMAMYITKMAQDIQNCLDTKIPNLRKSLEIFLDEYELQKNNPCFIKDYVDLLRQYTGELFNLNVFLLNKDFITKDKNSFEQNIIKIKGLLDNLEGLLNFYSPYKISSWFEKIKNLPKYEEYENIIKTSMFTFAHLDEGSIDYPTKDIYEVFKFYCKPRVLSYLNKLETSFGSDIKNNELKDEYKRIEKNWITSSLKDLICIENIKTKKDSLKSIGKDLLSKRFLLDEKFGYLKSKSLKSFNQLNLKVVWEDTLNNVDNWKITYYKDGEMVSDGEIATIYPPKNRRAIVFGRDIPNINIEDYPILSFKFKQKPQDSDVSFEALSRFVIWITWKDINGKSYRNRVFQKELIQYNKWIEVNLNLYSILSIISTPKEISKIEIESNSYPVSFDWIKIGKEN